MTSRIEQIIDELEEYIENCKPKFMSNTEIIVNKDAIDELKSKSIDIANAIKNFKPVTVNSVNV